MSFKAAEFHDLCFVVIICWLIDESVRSVTEIGTAELVYGAHELKTEQSAVGNIAPVQNGIGRILGVLQE